jgi:hypothetical protein
MVNNLTNSQGFQGGASASFFYFERSGKVNTVEMISRTVDVEVSYILNDEVLFDSVKFGD